MSKGLKVSYIPYFHDDMNDVAFSKKYNYRWSNYLKKMIEDDGGEIHTFDILPFEEADAILCFDNVYFQNNRFFKELYSCDKLGCTTHIEYEPPSANCKIHSDDGLKKLSNLFKSLITYNDNVVNNDTIIKGCIGDFYTKKQKYNNDFKKRKLLTIIANDRCGLFLFERHPNELYSEREKAVRYFQDKCPKDFDLYGDYWPDDLKKCWKKKLSRDEKSNYMRKYKFIISYDSICKQNGYVSEKIFDCFNAKVVPIYWGADNVTNYIPKECFIDRRKFSSDDELFNFLVNMKENEYNKYIHAIEKYLESEQYLSLFSSYASAKIIYKELCKEKRIINKRNVKTILKEFDNKRMTDVRYNYFNNCYDYHYPTEATINNIEYKEENGKENYVLSLILYCNKKYKIDIYGKNGDNSFFEINSKRETYDKVYNGDKIEFNIDLLNIINNKGISLYSYNNDDVKFTPLDIEKIFEIDSYLSPYVTLKDNKFVCKLSKKEKIKQLLKKYHLYRIGIIIIRLLKFPFIIIREFINIFKK